jgi:TRAP-type C4-dicarboxylate transport system permease small subunit
MSHRPLTGPGLQDTALRDIAAPGVLQRVDAALAGALRWLLITLLAGMALIVFTNVVLRYATNTSLVWAEEVARYAMVWLTLLGAGPVLRTGGHIAVENLQDGVPTSVARALRAAIVASLCGLSVGMVVMGVQYMQRAQYQLTPSTQVSFAYVYAAMPVGGAVLLWSTLAIAAGYVRERRFEADAASAGHQEGVQI